MLSVIGIMAGILFLILTLSAYARGALNSLWRTGTHLFQKPFRYQWLHIIIGHILLRGCRGLAFFFFVRGLASVSWKHAGILTACYAFAWIVGFLSFLTPGGLGIREGLLGLLLANYMPIPQATLIALLSRVWMLSAEIVLAYIALFLYKHAHTQHIRMEKTKDSI